MLIHIVQNNERLGPFTLETLREKVQRGELSPQTQAWHASMTQWAPLHTLLSLPQSSPPPLGALPFKPAKTPVRSSNFPGYGSAALGLLGFLFLIGILAFVIGGGSLRGTMTGLGIAALFMLAMAFIGIVLGIMGVSARDVRKASSVVGLSLNIVVCVCVVGLMTVGVFRLKSKAAWRGQTVYQSTPSEASTKPIPVSPNASSENEDYKIFKKWYDKNFLEAYNTIGIRNEKWDKAAVEFITDWIKYFQDDLDAPLEKERFARSQKLLALNCDDPLILYLAAKSQVEAHQSAELMEKAIGLLEKSKYPSAFVFSASLDAIRYQRQMNKDPGALQKADRRALHIFKTWMKNADPSPEEIVFLQNELLQTYVKSFFDRNSEEICRVLESNPKIEKWVLQHFWGEHHIRMAWQARGGGYSNTVTEEGWKGFRANLTKASEELTSSWKLQPKDPGAATAMIEVSMGLSDNHLEDMRLWFERAVAARIDHRSAYTSMLWGLRPRWFGSHEEMIEFGRQCLKTGRFDTGVPYYYLQALLDVSSEMDEAPDAVFMEARIYRDLESMLNGYLKEPTQARHAPFYHTIYAIVAYKTGNLDDSKHHLEAINFTLNENASLRWDDDFSQLVEKVCALTGPAKAAVAKGEEAYELFRADRAVEYFSQAEKQSQNDERSLRFIRNRLAALKLEKSLATGEWVDFLPATDFSGWKAEVGEWTMKSDGTLEVSAGAKGMMLKCLARSGPHFEIKGSVEFVSSSTGDYQAGILFGYLHQKKDGWQSFRIKRTKREGEVAYFSRHFYLPEKSNKIPVPNQNTFRIQSWKGAWNAYVNGKPVVLDYVPKQQDLAMKNDSLLGFGGYADQNESVVRYKDVKVRRLKSPPSAVE